MKILNFVASLFVMVLSLPFLLLAALLRNVLVWATKLLVLLGEKK